MYKLAKEYFFTSENRYLALFLVLGISLSIGGIAALNIFFSWWMTYFWGAISAMSMPLYMQSIQLFVLLTASYMAIATIQDYLVGKLSIHWRIWLTEKLITQYTSEPNTNYLDLARHPLDEANFAQCIQEDTQQFVENALSLSTTLLFSVLTFATFVGSLWVIGGSLTFSLFSTSFIIPGYLVWVAFLFAVLTTTITYWIGKTLANLSYQQQNLEADFREDLAQLNHDAESIALDHGEVYYRSRFANQLQAIGKTAYQTLRVNIAVSAFNAFQQRIGIILPYIIAAPMYFAGLTSLAQLMEVGYAFSQLQASLNWFNDSFQTIAAYQASLKRLSKLINAMQNNRASSTTQINHQETGVNALSVNDLSTQIRGDGKFLMRNLSLTFVANEHVLIRGSSGLGKSTLFKVLGATWNDGSGEVVVVNSNQMCFLPQKPSLPNDTLKAVLSYPQDVNTYSDDECIAVLNDIGMDKLIPDLQRKDTWTRRLSGGEQQRISFARALLRKREWLFLDEATSALDEESEETMYRLIKARLTTTTCISIAHRSTVAKFHNKVTTLRVDTNQQARPVEQTFFQSQRTAMNAPIEPILSNLPTRTA